MRRFGFRLCGRAKVASAVLTATTILVAGTLAISARVAAADFVIPDCQKLDTWAAGLEQGAAVPLNAATSLPSAFSQEVTTQVFGVPFLSWTTKDGRSLDSALKSCQRVLRKDKAAAAVFGEHREAIVPALRTLKSIEAARSGAEKALARIEAGDKPADLITELSVLASAREAELKDFSTRFTEVGRLARSLAELPSEEIAEIQTRLQSQTKEMTGDATSVRLAEIAKIPESVAGIFAARQFAFDARRELGELGVPVIRGAEEREAAIRATLASASPMPAMPPTCAEFLKWAATTDLGETRRTRAGAIYIALEEPMVETLFGQPAAAWTEADFAMLGDLGTQCRQAAKAGLLEGDSRALQNLAGDAAALARQGGNLPERYAALATARAEAERMITEAAGATEDAEGLAALASIASGVGRARLEPEDAERVEQAVFERRTAVVTAVLAGPRAGIEAAPATLEGIAQIRQAFNSVAGSPVRRQLTEAELKDFAGQTMARLNHVAVGAFPEFEAAVAATSLDEEGMKELKELADRNIAGEGPAWAPYRSATDARRDRIAEVLVEKELPKLDELLAELPETPEGLAKALSMKVVAERRARMETSAYARYGERAAVRAMELRAALYAARCAQLVDLSGDEAGQQVLVGSELAPLGRFVCALGARSNVKPSYTAPGLFGSEHRIEFVGSGGYLIKIILQEAEVRPGVTALVGMSLEEPTGSRQLTTEQWAGFAQTAAGVRGTGACSPHAARVAADTAQVNPALSLALAECLIADPWAEL